MRPPVFLGLPNYTQHPRVLRLPRLFRPPRFFHLEGVRCPELARLPQPVILRHPETGPLKFIMLRAPRVAQRYKIHGFCESRCCPPASNARFMGSPMLLLCSFSMMSWSLVAVHAKSLFCVRTGAVQVPKVYDFAGTRGRLYTQTGIGWTGQYHLGPNLIFVVLAVSRPNIGVALGPGAAQRPQHR